jgi:hypothetical protein
MGKVGWREMTADLTTIWQRTRRGSELLLFRNTPAVARRQKQCGACLDRPVP